MPPKPFRLSPYELQWARNGEPPDESTYRNHELRKQVQEKADLIGNRLDVLRRDLELIGLNEEIDFFLLRSPNSLGATIGEIAVNLLYEGDPLSSPKNPDERAELEAEFLAGVINGLDQQSPHDSATAPAAKQFREDLIDRVQQKISRELEREVAASEEWFEDVYKTREEDIQRARAFIQEVLEAGGYPSSQWVVDQIQFGLVDSPEGYPYNNQEWDPVEELSETDVLQFAKEESLPERHALRKQIDLDVERLYKEWRGIQPIDVFEVVVEQDSRSVFTGDIGRETGDRDSVTAILNDLAGVTGRRKSSHERVHTDAPILNKEDGNRWEVTEYGEALADWLFEAGLGFSTTAAEEQAAIAESLGLRV